MRLYLHLECEFHFLLKRTQIHFDHAVDEGSFVHMLILCLLEQAEEAIVDYAWKQRILKESYFINELYFIVGLFGTVATHCHILKDGLEVRFGHIV